MSRDIIPNSRLLELAQSLLAHEAAANPLADPSSTALVRVFEGLRRSLSTLAGASGFRALLARALTLAKPKASGLSAVKVNPDGSFEGLAALSDNAASEAGATLIAELLGLLAEFIGEPLTMHTVHDVWPDLTVYGNTPPGENKNDAGR